MWKSITALFLYLLYSAACCQWHCGHESWQNFAVQRRRLAEGDRRLQERDNTWQPIRISVYWGSLDISSGMEQKLRAAVAGSVNWLQHVLSVKPVRTSWRLASQSCGNVEFTGSILTDSFSADYVFFVQADDDEDNGLAGSAVYCEQDDATGQPVVGVFYFNANAHKDVADEYILRTAIHEMTHALGFTPSLYSQYLQSDGSHYAASSILITERVRDATVLKLALPHLVAKARTAFGCSTLDGIELEQQGNNGTAGAHWEKRIMYNDFMVGDVDVFDFAYTDVTLALFEDMGWYDVSYQYTTSVVWGYRSGCAFLDKKCVSNGLPITSDFCTDKTGSVPMCDFTHLRKGTCNLITYEDSLPAAFQYFSSPKLGGKDGFLDYCPVVKPSADGNCRDLDSVELEEDYGEQAGEDARCVTGNYSKSGSGKEHAACHSVRCSGSTAIITIGSTTVTCPESGGDVEVSGFPGVLHCPPSSILCRQLPCTSNCHGFGYCSSASTCVCDDGSESCTESYSADSALLFHSGLLWLLAN